MSAHYLLYGKYKERGWSDETKLQLCMEFIDRMDVFGAFKEFLQKTVEEEYWDSLEPFEKGEMVRSALPTSVEGFDRYGNIIQTSDDEEEIG